MDLKMLIEETIIGLCLVTLFLTLASFIFYKFNSLKKIRPLIGNQSEDEGEYFIKYTPFKKH